MHPLRTKLITLRRRRAAAAQRPPFNLTPVERARLHRAIVEYLAERFPDNPNHALFASHYLRYRRQTLGPDFPWATYTPATARNLAGQAMSSDRRLQ